MNEYGKLEIIDRQGWRNEFVLEKTVIHIGSNPRNDIVLEPARGGNVAPLHAQLIVSTPQPQAPSGQAGSGYQLVNLGDADILLGSAADQTLPPRSVLNLVDGTVFKLGEYTLIFHSNGDTYQDFIGGGQNIGLKLSLPQARLEPNRSLDGVITVGNLGDQGGVQIELDLEGLESDCYDLEPGPILSSGSERDVPFRLHHRGHKPLAGDCQVIIRATARRAYPGDEAIVSQVVQVMPCYRHRVRLVPPTGVGPPVRTEAGEGPAAEAGPSELLVEEQRPHRDRAGPAPTGQKDWWAPAPVKPKPAPPVAPPRQEQVQPPAPAPAEVVEPAPSPEIAPPSKVEVPEPIEQDTGPPPPPAVGPGAAAQVELAQQVPVVDTGPSAQVEKVAPIEEEVGPPPIPAQQPDTSPPVKTAEQPTAIEPAPSFKVEGLAPSTEEPPPTAEVRSSPQAIVEEVSRDDVDMATAKKAWWSRLLPFQPFSRPEGSSSQAVIEEMVEDEEEEDEVFPDLEAEVWQSVIQAELLGQVVVGDEEAYEADVFPQPLRDELEVEADAGLEAQAEEAEIPPGGGEAEAVAVPEVEVAPPPPAVKEQPVEPEADMPAQEIEEETIVEAPAPQPAVEPEADVQVQVEEEEMVHEAIAPQPSAELEPEAPVQAEEEMAREAAAPEPGVEPEASQEEPDVGQPPEPEIEPEPAVEPEPELPADDWWWTPETETGSGQKVLKMKASPPPEIETEVSSTPEAESPPAAQEWWTPEDQAEPAPPVPDQQVLKLKASLPPEAEEEPESETEAGLSPSAEDWWSSEPEED
jgi:hypothetical protein